MRYEKRMSKIKRNFLFIKSAIIEFLSKLKTIIFMDKKQLFYLISDNQNKFDYELAIAVIVKNEADYILEWIEYHRLIGFSKFYIYDNDSTDDIHDVLKGYVEEGIVTLQTIHGHAKQLDAYNHAIKQAKSETRWLMILDADEFVQNLTNINLGELIGNNHVGMLIGWMIFGSSGQTRKKDGLVIERFTHRADNKFISDYKIILNPRKILRFKNPHYAQMIGKIVDENGKVIHSYPYHTSQQAIPAPRRLVRINHYYTKSLEEFREKSERGYADSDSTLTIRKERSLEDFNEHDRNEVEDLSMEKFVPKICEQIQKYKKFNQL